MYRDSSIGSEVKKRYLKIKNLLKVKEIEEKKLEKAREKCRKQEMAKKYLIEYGSKLFLL